MIHQFRVLTYCVACLTEASTFRSISFFFWMPMILVLAHFHFDERESRAIVLAKASLAGLEGRECHFNTSFR